MVCSVVSHHCFNSTQTDVIVFDFVFVGGCVLGKYKAPPIVGSRGRAGAKTEQDCCEEFWNARGSGWSGVGGRWEDVVQELLKGDVGGGEVL